MRLLAGLLAFAALAKADQRTIAMVNDSSPRDLQEIATVLRTVADIQDLGIDTPHQSFTMTGNTTQLDAAAWLIGRLDRPAGWQPSQQEKENPSTREYPLATTTGPSTLRIYYLRNDSAPRDVQETLTILRTVLDVQKIFNYSRQHALVMRGTEPELSADEWLLQAMESRSVSPPYPLRSGDVLRVFPLPPQIPNADLQQLVTDLRSKPLSINKVFPRSAPPVIAVRGTAAQLDQAEKMIPR